MSMFERRLSLGTLSKFYEAVAVVEEGAAAVNFLFLLFAEYVFMSLLALGEEPINIKLAHPGL